MKEVLCDLLAELRRELADHGPVEVVTLAHCGPAAEYLRELGFHAPVSTLSMLRAQPRGGPE